MSNAIYISDEALRKITIDHNFDYWPDKDQMYITRLLSSPPWKSTSRPWTTSVLAWKNCSEDGWGKMNGWSLRSRSMASGRALRIASYAIYTTGMVFVP